MPEKNPDPLSIRNETLLTSKQLMVGYTSDFYRVDRYPKPVSRNHYAETAWNGRRDPANPCKGYDASTCRGRHTAYE